MISMFNKHGYTSIALIIGSLLLVTGCVRAPQVQLIPAALENNKLSDVDTQRTGNYWWRSLQDSELNSLIIQGLDQNPSAQIALARLAQAQTDLQIAKASRWPSVVASGTRNVQNFSDSQADTRSDLGSLDIGWDFGLWGKRRLQIQAAQQLQQALWFEHQSVALAISTSIADTYYRVVEHNRQSALLAAQIQVSQDLEQLIDARFRLGQASASELYQQREETSALQQLKLFNDTLQQTLEINLDVLLGQAPDDTPRVHKTYLPDALGPVVVADAQHLITHRADLRASYAELRQAASLAGIAFAERLPSLQVTASLTSLTSKAASSEWVGYTLDLAAPLFTGGQLRGLAQRALHQLEEARQRYLQVWLTALEEVNALKWRYQQQQQIIATLTQRQQFAQQALQAARNRYVLGDQNYLDVLTALRGLQQADRLLISEQRQLVTLWIGAVQATGQPMCDATGGKSSDTPATCKVNWQI